MTPTKTTNPPLQRHPASYRDSKPLFFAQSPAIPARVTFRIYAKTTVALARGACRHAPLKIYESPRIISGTAEALRRSALFMIFNPRAPAKKCSCTGIGSTDARRTRFGDDTNQ